MGSEGGVVVSADFFLCFGALGMDDVVHCMGLRGRMLLLALHFRVFFLRWLRIGSLLNRVAQREQSLLIIIFRSRYG